MDTITISVTVTALKFLTIWVALLLAAIVALIVYI